MYQHIQCPDLPRGAFLFLFFQCFPFLGKIRTVNSNVANFFDVLSTKTASWGSLCSASRTFYEEKICMEYSLTALHLFQTLLDSFLATYKMPCTLHFPTLFPSFLLFSLYFGFVIKQQIRLGHFKNLYAASVCTQYYFKISPNCIHSKII